jgi:hypothetical protein
MLQHGPAATLNESAPDGGAGARESLKAVVEGGEDGDDVEDLKSGADRERKVPRAPRNTQELFREK